MQTKKTKIVATLGPSSSSKETIKKMILAGMNVARLNFSHGTHNSMQSLIDTVRELSKELDTPIAIIGDLQGPKLRLGEIDGILELKQGDKIILSANPEKNEIPLQFDFSSQAKPGQSVFLNDGLIELKVLSVDGKSIETVAQNAGKISSHKSVNIPETTLGLDAFTKKDQDDAKFCLENKVDYLALSFVDRPEDMDLAKEMIKKISPATKTLVKLERKQAMQNLESIMQNVDVAMVARGDLATETSAAEVPIFQQKIIRLARQMQIPVIVATQMLESMTENPRPTRAEASDVANAVLIQADAVMLSAESATGKYPVESVQTMTDIIVSVEEHPDFKQYIKINWDSLSDKSLKDNALASSAAALAFRIGTPIIALGSITGQTARMISSFRPQSTIIAAAHDVGVQNQLALVWGVVPILVLKQQNPDQFQDGVLSQIKKNNLAEPGSNIVFVAGRVSDTSASTDTVKVVSI